LSDAEPSHRETQTSWPSPLGRTGARTWGIWALPAAALSWVSAAAFGIVFLFLVFDDQARSLFVLPRWAGLGLATGSAALAWSVVLRCRRRPGRIGPRLWAFALALFTSGFALLVFAFPYNPWVHSLAFAGLAAVATLAPRLLKLHPDSRWVQRIAPLALLSVLLLALPAAGLVRRSLAEKKQAKLRQAIEQLRQWTSDVEEVTGRKWRLEEDREGSAQAVKKLARIQVAPLIGQIDLWRSAATLDKGGELTAQAQGLVEAVVNGILSPQAPRLSRLKVPPVQQVPGTYRLEENAIFPEISNTVGLYYQELGRLFAEMGAKVGTNDAEARVALEKYCADERSKLQDRLAAEIQRWADGWAVFRVPDRRDFPQQSEVPLVDLLHEPLSDLAHGSSWQPADLPRWFNLSYGHLLTLEKSLSGCLPLRSYTDQSWPGRRLYRLDCDSYSLRAKSAGAALRVEMRLVYLSEVDLPLSGDQKLYELDFLFPFPVGEDRATFEGQVMADLKNAVGSVRGVEVRDDGRSRSPTSFLVSGRGILVRVYAVPRLMSFAGREVLVVRAEERKGP
jgi:hypothetical protein